VVLPGHKQKVSRLRTVSRIDLQSDEELIPRGRLTFLLDALPLRLAQLGVVDDVECSFEFTKAIFSIFL
jgi:hypothetical protein